MTGELLLNAFGVVLAHDDAHADAHVEDAEHFVVVDFAQAAAAMKDRWNGPTTADDFGIDVREENISRGFRAGRRP